LFFADINVSQGTVATYARCGGIFNTRLTAKLLKNLSVKNNLSRLIKQNYGHESLAPLFWPTMHIQKSKVKVTRLSLRGVFRLRVSQREGRATKHETSIRN